MRLIPTALVVFVAFFLGACPGDDTAADASMPDTGLGEPRLEIGTGGIGRYEQLDDGDTALLAEGCQGGQHVWIGLRAYELDTSRALIRLVVERERDEFAASIPFQVRLTFEPVAGADYDELTGLQLQVPDPADVLSEQVIIRGRVTESSGPGREVEAERRVTVEWGDEVCGGSRDPDAGQRDGDAGAGDAGTTDAGSPDAS